MFVSRITQNLKGNFHKIWGIGRSWIGVDQILKVYG